MASRRRARPELQQRVSRVFDLLGAQVGAITAAVVADSAGSPLAMSRPKSST